MAAGDWILREGEACAAAPFVIEGSIRVFKLAENGREMTLYRIERGQCCIMSAGCARGIASFPANAVAEKRTVAAFFPSELVGALLAGSPGFREFVMAQYAERLASVVELVQEVAFRRVDERLAAALTELAERASGGRIATTHRELAESLGTSREVVSRILKDWEIRGRLKLGRGEIRLLGDLSPL